MGIFWKDKSLNIKWKYKKPILSKKDESHSSLKEFIKRLGKEFQGQTGEVFRGG